MALKIFCDICDEECKDKDFMFDAKIMQTIYFLNENKTVPQQRNIQICKKCYDKHFKKTIETKI